MGPWTQWSPPGSTVLEAGCGVGAQTVALAERSPQAHFTSVDISAASVVEAERRCKDAGVTNVTFERTMVTLDHGDVLCSRAPGAARAAIGCQIELQARTGGDALIGRQVYPLMVAAGFEAVKVFANRPSQQDSSTRRASTPG